jgi:hypothetical protein
MTNIGKPYERKHHVRFDEEGLKISVLHSSKFNDEVVQARKIKIIFYSILVLVFVRTRYSRIPGRDT